MDRVEEAPHIRFEGTEYRDWLSALRRPVLIAAVAITVLLLLIVVASMPAWDLLGAGRGFVPEELYFLSGFFLVLGTTFGQAIGWAIGTGIAIYVMTLVGFSPSWTTARVAMTAVYLGFAGIPFLFFHILYGGWLLGMPREGLREWLTANYPSAYWLLIYAHPVIDLSLLPLAVIFLAILWVYSERVQRDTTLQTALGLTLLGTSLAIALSLAIHSILVHVRVGL
jgi:hypothetical protein